MERMASKITDHLIALTSGEAEDYIRLRVMNSEDISIIPSGISISRFTPDHDARSAKRRELRIPEDAVVVGFVGWLWPVKGVRYLVESMVAVLQEDPRVFLVLVGQGDEEPALRNQVAEMGMEERVFFLGWRSDVNEILPCFDLFVLPSLNEGMGRVLAEAMAAKLPVVGTRVGGIPDLIKHGENGLLVPPANAAALREAIQRLLDDPVLRERMGARGQDMCRCFSIDAMICKIIDVYKRMEATTPSVLSMSDVSQAMSR
jgi:glycosyltransferase involved in cell wall biosynthesis